MSKIKYVVPALILALGMVATTVSYGKPEYTKKEKKGCKYCHVTASSKEVNKTGECYGQKKTLEGCPTPQSK